MESVKPIFFKFCSSKKDNMDWYYKRKSFLEHNQEFLMEVLDKEETDYSLEDLAAMQKFYLCYPNGFPESFTDLSWEHIKVLLNLYSSLARDFYALLVSIFHLSVEKLKEVILKDFYAKYQAILQEMNSYEILDEDDFWPFFMDIESCVYEVN